MPIPLCTYELVGEDDWSRGLYRNEAGRTVVDVDGQLHSISDWGEPISPIGYPTPKPETKE
jgi:hypothetical protein